MLSYGVGFDILPEMDRGSHELPHDVGITFGLRIFGLKQTFKPPNLGLKPHMHTGQHLVASEPSLIMHHSCQHPCFTLLDLTEATPDDVIPLGPLASSIHSCDDVLHTATVQAGASIGRGHLYCLHEGVCWPS